MQGKRGTTDFLAVLSSGHFAVFCAVILLMSGCKNSGHMAPVEQLDQPPSIRLQQHVVSRGDTLYSISWRYGMDYRQLADLNGIASPFTIYPGQKLRLADSAPASSLPSSGGAQTMAAPDVASGVMEVGVVSEVAAVENTGAAASAQSVAPEVKRAVEHSVERDNFAAMPVGGRWQWPAMGKVVSGFSSTDHARKGIDLDGKLGEPVRAAAGGDVVYAGTGLTGYGQLVIIKHDEQFLSAYAHNSRMLVAEGQTVKVGQKIAEIGSSGTDRNKLHFEVRRDGKPVDPLLYLPKR